MQCELVQQFFDLLDNLNRAQKYPRDYGAGSPVTYGEIAALAAIHDFPDINVSGLAEKLNVTKSAVTQVTAKLLEKQLIEKYTKGKNKKEMFFRLTDAGTLTRAGYAEFHRAANEKMRAYLCGMKPHDKEVLLGFFNMVTECAPICVFSCQTGGGCISPHTNSQ